MPKNRRTAIPEPLLESVGNRIKAALMQEHTRHEVKEGKKPFSTYRFCRQSGIPADTILAYMKGRRMPSAMDLREIAMFTDRTMEWFMEPLPKGVGLSREWYALSQAQRRADQGKDSSAQ